MGLLSQDVTFLNFDGAYKTQPRLSHFAKDWIELSDIPESNLFCTHRALKKISERISKQAGHGITFIGNGNYHYVTCLFLSKIDRPFTLILFDNHTDTKLSDSEQGLLSCGSWVARSLANLPNLQRALIIGVCSEFQDYSPDLKDKIILWPETGHWENLDSAIPTRNIYISIDKDVLDRAYAVTNWDQGKMKLQDLLSALKKLMRQKNILGMDVCGELPVSPVEVWRYANELRLNEQTNLAILQSVFSGSSS
ncbi:arginase family protein [Thermoactinomyces mirandus]|uniref:Arginase family protein n=1 Tax=Thermoactinomyces mirandus TaxID=2756294 RepID=A0A7W2ASM3_9BACL|nr:arginase family protein [Thermoactinomyces mirandus]MBA4602631.1 arginase family protein [Thermoactinomyces mirandus]